MNHPQSDPFAPLQHARSAAAYTVRLAHDADDVRTAQRLRYKVLAEAFGARFPLRLAGHEIDHFDAFCEHLVVHESATQRVVGTCRILTPEAARRIGSYDAEGGFYLTRLQHLRSRMVEVGRFCIHPDCHGGSVLPLLWSRLAEFMRARNYDSLLGCAQVSMVDGGHNVANLFQQLDPTSMAPAEYSVFPRHRLPVERLVSGQPAIVPPLVKGYLRSGAWICGEPAWNPEFNAADLLLLLPMARMNPCYVSRSISQTT
jgi:putative hemolysin